MKVLHVTAKCSDLFSATLEEAGKPPLEYSGYVPDFMPGEHYGDYVELSIDVKSGRILNWKAPSQKELDKVFPPASTYKR